jgi:hypothetical protein
MFDWSWGTKNAGYAVSGGQDVSPFSRNAERFGAADVMA